MILSGFPDIDGGSGGPFNPRVSQEIVEEIRAAIDHLRPYH